MPAASRFTLHVSRFTSHVSRFTFHVFRSTLYALLSTCLLLASCSPVDPPRAARTPRIVFPTDNRVLPTRTPTPQPTATPTPRPTPVAPPVTEYRALWVDGSGQGLQTPEQVTQLIRDCQSISCNALLTQIRIHGNVLHGKSAEPRLYNFSNGFDPLADVIGKAHAATPKIEVHAWINVMPVWPTDGEPPQSANHVFNTHGPAASGADMWLTLNEQGNTGGSGLYWLDPGHPAAARYAVNQVVDVVKNYPVDGVHLDFIRLGGVQWGYNPVSLARFRARANRTDTPSPDDAQWSQWRRDQVTAIVRRIWLESTAANPRIKVSAALVPWGNGPASDDVWSSTSAYRAVFQDWRAWLQEGILDLAIPMNYFPDSSMSANFDQWIEFEKSHRYNRQVVIGLGSYLNSVQESAAQIRRARGRSASGAYADGVSIYVYRQTNKDAAPFSQFVETTTLGLTPSPAFPVFAHHAVMPDMPWKSAPTTGHLMGWATKDNQPADGETVTLTGKISRVVTADGNGFWGSVDLAPGAYRVAAGQVITTVIITAGQVASVTLDLKR